MNTPGSRTQGLQHVTHLPWNCGAWFIFPEFTDTGFWMKNTPIPLQLIYLTDTHQVISIHDLQAHDSRIVKCDTPYKYALEVNPGWCKAYDIRVGDHINHKVDLIFT